MDEQDKHRQLEYVKEGVELHRLVWSILAVVLTLGATLGLVNMIYAMVIGYPVGYGIGGIVGSFLFYYVAYKSWKKAGATVKQTEKKE